MNTTTAPSSSRFLSPARNQGARRLQFRYALFGVGIAVALFFGMLILFEAGRQLGQIQLERIGEASRAGVGVLDAPIYALLGLLIGFSFSGSANRFNERRQAMVHQVAAIRTAWHRADLLPVISRAAIRADICRYLDALLAAYAQPPLSERESRERAAADMARDGVWADAVAACMDATGEKARMLLLPAVTEMFVAVDRERLMRRVHTPAIVLVMIVVTALASFLFLGYALATGPRSWMHILGAATTISLATYVVVELEFPRAGLVRVDSMDRALVELRSSMT